MNEAEFLKYCMERGIERWKAEKYMELLQSEWYTEEDLLKIKGIYQRGSDAQREKCGRLIDADAFKRRIEKAFKDGFENDAPDDDEKRLLMGVCRLFTKEIDKMPTVEVDVPTGKTYEDGLATAWDTVRIICLEEGFRGCELREFLKRIKSRKRNGGDPEKQTRIQCVGFLKKMLAEILTDFSTLSAEKAIEYTNTVEMTVSLIKK